MGGKYQLLGIVGVALIVSACGEAPPITCTLPARRDRGELENTQAQFRAGTNCDEIRELWAAGQPVPSIGAPPVDTVAQPEVTPERPPEFAGALVPDTDGLVPITDRQERVEELTNNLPPVATADDPTANNPFSAIAGTVPQLPVLQRPAPPPAEVNADPIVILPAPPPPPVSPPDTSAANAVRVTGFMQVGRSRFVILQSPGDPFPLSVQVGETIADGQVTVAQVTSDADRVVVILEQNGIQVPKEVSINPSASAATANNPADESTLF